MEKTLANISKQEKKDKKRLEKIEKAGYTKENAFLIAQGFEKLGKNLKALRKCKGNQEEALKLLQLKQKKQNEKLNAINEKIKSQNFEAQMDYLISKGFKNQKKNMKYLALYSGDQEKALAQLSQRKNKPSLEEKIKAFGYEKENTTLVANGFSNLKRNLKLLQLYEGKVERVCDHYNHNKEHKYEQLLKLIEEKGFEKQNQLLIEKGLTKLRRNLKLLIKYKGDVATIWDVYTQKKEEKMQDLKILCKTHNVFSQFEALVVKGHKPKRVVKLMKFYQWDAEKTFNHLESNKNKHSCFEKQIKDLGYDEQNKLLMEKGFKHLKKNLKLLQLNDGNVDKVLESYKKKAPKGDKIEKTLKKLNLTQQYHVLIDKDGTLKPKKVIKALIKYNGDVKEAAGHLERKKLHKEFSLKEWANQVHVLYLDGNNMLFANDNIRKLYLMKKKKEAEELLRKIAKEFGVKKKLEKVVLMFDRGEDLLNTEEIALTNSKMVFEVRCAKAHKNADDALVALAENEKHLTTSMVVTADVELRRRLIEKGVKLFMGPKDWFVAAKKDLGSDFDKI